MASVLSTTGKNVALNALAGVAVFGSLHSGDPGATGTLLELTGGTPAYARKALTWGAASGGILPLAAVFPTWDVPVGSTVAYVGLWSLVTGGVYYGCFDVTDEVFAGQGTYALTAGSITF
jgi:hypothetical protein